ncbi:unnamed protein product [Sphagnum jensenii]|uniref:Uncharacterized protein n=1 Tax=Sphagnum jensenii TaxID=128206 RepID=A0ABP1A2F9_9BRYO
MYGSEYDQPCDSPTPGKYIHIVDYFLPNPEANNGGGGRTLLLATVQAHLLVNQKSSMFKVAQMLDDLFVPRDVENLVAEAARTNIGDVEAPAVEVVGTNAGSGVDGINIVNMVQQAFSIMEQLAVVPESMPKQSDLPLDDDGVEANNP